MDCSPPGPSIHGIFQARVLEWVAISFSRDLPGPGIEPRSPSLLYYLSQLWLVAQFSSCCMRAQWLWCTGLVTLRHVGSSQTRDWTHVPALKGEFLTTWPPGRSVFWSYNVESCACILRWYICFLGLRYKLLQSEWLKAGMHSLNFVGQKFKIKESAELCSLWRLWKTLPCL